MCEVKMQSFTKAEKHLIKVLGITVAIFFAFFSLCKLISGIAWDRGFFGDHFWLMLAIVTALLIAVSAVIVLRVHKGKKSYVFAAVEAVSKYRFLMKQLVKRDFRTKYLRSFLGVVWSVLNPLMMMLVQYAVFSTIFKSSVPNFAAYLIIGNVCFTFFTESSSLTMNSIVGNAGLITKVYMPKYIYPLTRTISSLINLAISLVPMLLVCLVTGVRFSSAFFVSPYFFLCLFVFCFGMGMLLSCAMVFFRDTQFLWGIITTVWTYVTPIFYTIDIIPENLQWFYKLNPMYVYISGIRSCIMYGMTPLPGTFLKAAAASLIMLVIGAAVFKKGQDRFILYL